jgi:uncharacterized membrane protein YkvI
MVAAVLVILAGMLAQFGIVALIADGYGTLAWGFMVVYIIPLLTIGVWRLIKVARNKNFLSDEPSSR